MEETEFTDSETVRRTVMDTTLEIRMQEFRTAGKRVREEKYMKHKNASFELKVDICVFAFPNGADKNTEGWLVVLPDVYLTCIHKPMNSALSWIVSVIDIEGNSRFPQSFERDGGRGGTLEVPPDADFSHTKYLERSFILSRADEFLVDGVLTLRCDVYLSWSGVSLGYPSRRFYDRQRSPLKKCFDSLPQRVCFEKDAETGDPSDPFTLFDLTSPILTSPEFQDFIERFGLYGGSLQLPSPTSESKEDITEILEHVWIFDARPDKFILSLDERKDTVGARLLKASSLIRRCAEAPMKEQREKSIVFSDTDSQTFRIVLFFLIVGTLREFEFYQLVGVYTFSHLYEMEELQRRCAEYMTEDIEPGRDFEHELGDFEELERIAELYWDEYLSELLESRRHVYEKLEKDLPQPRVEERPYSDCYI